MKKIVKQPTRRRINESVDMITGYTEYSQSEINQLYKSVTESDWIDALYNHYNDIKKDKISESKEMTSLVVKTMMKMTNETDPEKFRVVFGWYLFVIDYDIVYRGAPAYIHITRSTETNEWKLQVFKSCH